MDKQFAICRLEKSAPAKWIGGRLVGRLSAALVSLLPGCASMVDTIPPASATKLEMHRTLDRINLNIERTGRPPSTLQDLPPSDELVRTPTDGWGRPLIYSVDESGTIFLKSLGADGKPGGSADIVVYQLADHGISQEVPTTR